MAKAKKAVKKTKKKAQSQFYTIKSIQKSADKWMENVKESKEKYVTKPLESGKDLVEDLRSDPIRMVEGWYSDSKDFIGDVAKDPKEVFKGFVDDGKELVEDVKKYFQATIDDVVDGGNDLYKGVKKDSQKLVDDLYETGWKFIDKIPMMKKIEEGVGNTLQSIPEKLNLPNKKDMDDLGKAIETLNQRMNTLSKKVAA